MRRARALNWRGACRPRRTHALLSSRQPQRASRTSQRTQSLSRSPSACSRRTMSRRCAMLWARRRRREATCRPASIPTSSSCASARPSARSAAARAQSTYVLCAVWAMRRRARIARSSLESRCECANALLLSPGLPRGRRPWCLAASLPHTAARMQSECGG